MNAIFSFFSKTFFSNTALEEEFVEACESSQICKIKELYNNSYISWTAKINGFLIACKKEKWLAINFLLETGFDVLLEDDMGSSAVSKWLTYLQDNPTIDLENYAKCLRLMLASKQEFNPEIKNKPLFFHLLDLYKKNILPFSFIKKLYKERNLSLSQTDIVFTLYTTINLNSEMNQTVSFLIKHNLDLKLLEKSPLVVLEKEKYDVDFFKDFLSVLKLIKDLYGAHVIHQALTGQLLFKERVFIFLREKINQLAEIQPEDRLRISEKSKAALAKIEILCQKNLIFDLPPKKRNEVIPKKIESLLDECCQKFDFETVKVIVEFNPELLNRPKSMAIYYAICHMLPQFVEYLIDKGADLNRKTLHEKYKNVTPLSFFLNNAQNSNGIIEPETLPFKLKMIDLLLKKGASANACDNNGKSVLQVLLNWMYLYPDQSEKIFKYIQEWIQNPTIHFDFNNEDNSGEALLVTALMNLYKDDFFKFIALVEKNGGDISFPYYGCINTNLKGHHEECLQHLNEFIEALNRVSLSNMNSDNYSFVINSTKFLAEKSSVFQRNPNKELSLYNFLLDIQNDRIFKMKRKENKGEYDLIFEDTAVLPIIHELLNKFKFLNLEKVDDFILTVSHLFDEKISFSSFTNTKRNYFKELQNLKKIEPKPILQRQTKKEESHPRNLEPSLPIEKKVHTLKTTLSKNEQKTQEIARKNQLKKLEKQEAKKLKLCEKEVIKKPKNKKESSVQTQAKPLPLPGTPIIGNDLNEHEVHELVKNSQRQDYTILSKEQFVEPQSEIFLFQPTQIDRLTVAINALKSLEKIRHKLQCETFTQEDLFSIAQKKSLEYHFLRCFEALAPTSETLRNDERDYLFFQKLNLFFLNETEIRSLRHALRGSFPLIKISDLYNLITVLSDFKLTEKLVHFRNKRSISKNLRKISDPCILTFHFDYKKKLGDLDKTKKNVLLLINIKKELEFISSCVKASDNKKVFSTYLDAIKKSLSDISKLAVSFLADDIFSELLDSFKEFKEIIDMGHKVAHHFDKNILMGQSLDEIDIAKIWTYFHPENNFSNLITKKIDEIKFKLVI